MLCFLQRRDLVSNTKLEVPDTLTRCRVFWALASCGEAWRQSEASMEEQLQHYGLRSQLYDASVAFVDGQGAPAAEEVQCGR